MKSQKEKDESVMQAKLGLLAMKKNKEQMRKISQARHTKIAGTPEHEKRKEQMRKRSQGVAILVGSTKIADTPEHKKQKNLISQKTSKLLQRKFKMGLISYLLCVIDVYIVNQFLYFMKISM